MGEFKGEINFRKKEKNKKINGGEHKKCGKKMIIRIFTPTLDKRMPEGCLIYVAYAAKCTLKWLILVKIDVILVNRGLYAYISLYIFTSVRIRIFMPPCVFAFYSKIFRQPLPEKSKNSVLPPLRVFFGQPVQKYI